MPVIMRSGRAEFPDLDLLASNDVDGDWHIIQLVPPFIENANGAHPTLLCELPRNRGSAGFRCLQVRDILPMLIYVHALVARDVKEVPTHRVNLLPRRRLDAVDDLPSAGTVSRSLNSSLTQIKVAEKRWPRNY
jgi:hypothetical protein